MPTIFDIAKKAGVSITTVSRALNGYGDVSPQTRQRVVQIAQELNYYPSAAARSLQGKRTNTIAFAAMMRDRGESESFFKEFIGLLTLSCFRHDLSLLATVADDPLQNEKAYRAMAGTGRVDGIILSDITPNDERIAILQETGIPFVAFGRTEDYNQLQYPLVDVDGAAGMRLVVNYLHGQGHRRIAHLSGPLNTSYALHRYDGYKDALHAHALPADPHLVSWDLQQSEETEAAVTRLLQLPAYLQPTAMVVSNDRLVLQVMSALEKHGKRVGREEGQIAVTGFDDLPFA